jgi:hypothetical protein
MFRDGKTAISAELAGILDRLGSNSERWWSRIEKLSKGRLLGRFFAASRERLREVARGLGVHHLANLGGCAARWRHRIPGKMVNVSPPGPRLSVVAELLTASQTVNSLKYLTSSSVRNLPIVKFVSSVVRKPVGVRGMVGPAPQGAWITWRREYERLVPVFSEQLAQQQRSPIRRRRLTE